eukprot:scaffold22883_cov60-Attheya_sp.AAC.1
MCKTNDPLYPKLVLKPKSDHAHLHAHDTISARLRLAITVAVGDRLESYRLALRNILGACFRCQSEKRAWHFAILLEENNPNSLSYLLGLTCDQLKGVLKACKLGQEHPRGFCIKIKAWEPFLISSGLCGTYFDRMSVSKVAKGQQWWIGLGTFVEGKEKYNPSSQFKNNQQPPPLDNKAQTEMQKNSRRILSILTLLKREEEALKENDNEFHAQEVRRINSARVEREHHMDTF